MFPKKDLEKEMKFHYNSFVAFDEIHLQIERKSIPISKEQVEILKVRVKAIMQTFFELASI